MRIVTNHKLVKRNSTIGRYSMYAGMALLVAALVVNFLAFQRPELIYLVLVGFLVGFTLTTIGTLLNNRWGRKADERLADSLKGLDDRYTLYNYRLGAQHVLAGPMGVMVLYPKFHTGPILYDGKKWHNPGARKTVFGLFDPDPLGNPILEAAGEVEALNKQLTRRSAEIKVPPQAAVVFLSSHAELQAKAAPLPVLHYKQLKDYVRKLPKDSTATADQLAQLDAAAA
ncbi:MAG: NERD domain-containing protein [Anaerolineales bacterium]|nr:NERD domain-containing protein [Anaerolineales bacterium]